MHGSWFGSASASLPRYSGSTVANGALRVVFGASDHVADHRVRFVDQRRRGMLTALVRMMQCDERAIRRLDNFRSGIGLHMQQAVQITAIANHNEGLGVLSRGDRDATTGRPEGRRGNSRTNRYFVSDLVAPFAGVIPPPLR